MSSIGNLKSTADMETDDLSPSDTDSGLMTAGRNERIREIAYYLWLDEGCPDDGAERHWANAETLLDSEPEQRKNIEGEPPGEPLIDAPPAPPAPVRRARREAAE